MKSRARTTTLVWAVFFLFVVSACGGAAAPTATPTAPRATAAATPIAYPERPITLIVPFAAGGDTDVPMRVVAEFLGKELGQPVVVQNVVGAGGSTGTRQVRAAKPDGYTLASIHEHTIINQRTGVVDYGPLDFEPIAAFLTSPNYLATEATNPWKDLKELVDDAKKRPNEITWGVTFGSTAQMFAFLFMNKSGTKFRPVGYEGTAQRITAILGKQIHVGGSPLSTAVQQIQAGRMRVLGLAWDKRDPRTPNVALFREQGVDMIWGEQRGWVAPKGTPIEIVRKLEAALKKVLDNPEVKKRLEDEQGNLITFKNREQYIELLKQEDVELTKAIKETGMTSAP